MKKLILKNLDLSSEDMLNRNHLKTIFGGYGGYDDEGGCKIAVRNADGSWGHWSDNTYSYEQAHGAYVSHQYYSDGSYASGYCCSSC